MIVGAITAVLAAATAVFKNRRRGSFVVFFDISALLIEIIAWPLIEVIVATPHARIAPSQLQTQMP
jgi:hypothetical protein